MRSIPVLVAAGLLTAGVGAAEPLSLPDAIRLALESNQEIRAAQARADAADARSDLAKGFRMPKVDLSEMLNYTDSPAESFALQLNQKRFDFNDFTQSDPNNPDFLTTWMTRLEVTMPLYTGGELGSRISQADRMASAEELQLRHTRQRVAFDAASAWVSLASAREQLEVLQKARDTTARHVEMARQFAAQGMIVEAEVLKAEVYLAQVDEMVIRADTGARLAEAALNFRLGVPQTTARQLAPTPPPAAVTGDVGAWIDDAIERRADLGAARHKLEAGRLEETVARAGYLPQVAVVGRYDLYDDTLFGTNGDSATVMAVARINLFKGGSDHAKLMAARHDTVAFESDVSRFEDGVQLEVRQAWQELETAKARRSTAGHAVASAHEALRVTETRFRQGLDTMLDLLDAETAAREAEMRETVAKFDVSLETYRLRFAAGWPLIDDLEEIQ